MPRRKTDIDLEEAVRLYEDNTLTFKEKAAQLGVSPDTLRTFLRNNGVIAPARAGKAASKLSVEKVTEFYINQNMSRKETAEKLGVSLATLGRFISANDIEKDNKKIVELREQTMLDRYGVKHALDSEEFKEKAKETCRENYGVDYPMQSSKVMQKSKDTKREKWGTEHHWQSDKYKELYYAQHPKEEKQPYSELSDEKKAEIQKERSERRRQTNLERYGVENPAQVPEFKEKAKKTTQARYGDENFFRTNTFREKALKTNRERYGTDNPMQSDEIKEKTHQTMLARYGADCSLQNPDVHSKTLQTNIEKYGDPVPMRNKDVQQKQQHTLFERYGADNPSKIEKFQEKKRSTSQERYGTDNPSKRFIEHIEEWDNRDLFIDVCQRIAMKTGRKPRVSDLTAYFNASPSSVYPKIHEFGCEDILNKSTSFAEDSWRQWLKNEHISHSDKPLRMLIPDTGRRREIDIYIPEYKLGLEIDPTATHNSTTPYYNNSEPKAEDYHQKKTELAEKAGINLIHIYDFLDNKKMKSIIKSLCHQNERIYARNTVCEQVNMISEKFFLEANHLQGYVKSEICYGLFSNDDSHELLALMSFGSPRYGAADEKEIRWELLRFCSKSGLTVVGGASKLFAAFVKEYSPDAVLSYANYDISNGEMYETLGFEYKRLTNPSYTWVKLGDPSDSYSWYVVNSKGFDNLFGTNYGKGTSNSELMEQAGYVKVYNSGNKVYIWQRTK